ncbi:MAG: alpha/beta hydrolase [Pseudomonadota bacterium]
MRQVVRILAALGVIASLTACASTPAPPNGVARASDGAPIAWSRTGAGDTALVFIHGWSCNSAFWREQVNAFAADYTVVTLDLPGHGQSGGDREPWRVGDYGADVAAVADALELERIVLIGHSMGGLVALRAAAELDGRAVAVIAADSLHDAEIRYTEAQAAPAIAAFSADYAGSMMGMFTGMAGPQVDPELAAWIAAEGAASRPEVGIGLFSNYTEIDATIWFREAGVPVRAINAAAGGMTPPTRTGANQQYADFEATILDGVGHFLQLEAPERFNAALRDTLSDLSVD